MLSDEFFPQIPLCAIQRRGLAKLRHGSEDLFGLMSEWEFCMGSEQCSLLPQVLKLSRLYSQRCLASTMQWWQRSMTDVGCQLLSTIQEVEAKIHCYTSSRFLVHKNKLAQKSFDFWLQTSLACLCKIWIKIVVLIKIIQLQALQFEDEESSENSGSASNEVPKLRFCILASSQHMSLYTKSWPHILKVIFFTGICTDNVFLQEKHVEKDMDLARDHRIVISSLSFFALAEFYDVSGWELD